MSVDFEKCILNAKISEENVNAGGHARIVARWDESEVRNCPVCGGLQFVEETNEQGYRFVTSCPGAYRLDRIALFNQARVPARFMNASFETFDTKRCIDGGLEIKKYIEEIKNFKRKDLGKLFEGGAGTGKTHLLCAGIRYLTLQLGIPCLYVDFSILISDIRAAYTINGVNASESEILRPLFTIPVLFLDELGKGRGTPNDFELRTIDEIVNRRYDNPDLTTFFASNYCDRDTSGYQLYYNKGYNPDSDSPMESEVWKDFSKNRWKEENKRKSEGEVKFNNVVEFEAWVRKLMAREHLEDRVSERTASRIRAMANPLHIKAPDSRRLVS